MREHVRHNRTFWDSDADDYQAAHGADLARRALAWGAFRIPESEVRALGDPAGNDVLELGCGAAQWSIALAALGARPVSLDVSRAQLRHARHASGSLPLLAADAERLPFKDAAFDLVFCDHGALSFCDPARTLPEVARVLRATGRLAFCTATPLLYLTWNAAKDKQSRKLHRTYDDLGLIDFDDGTVDWVLPAGEWIRLLRAHGFEVEDLTELRPGRGAATTYEAFAPISWARRWPAEWVWQARRRP